MLNKDKKGGSIESPFSSRPGRLMIVIAYTHQWIGLMIEFSKGLMILSTVVYYGIHDHVVMISTISYERVLKIVL